MSSLMEIKNVVKEYKDMEDIFAVKYVSININAGEFILINGESGAGKSTLLYIMGLMISPDEGEVYYNGELIDLANERILNEYRRRNMGFVFQETQLVEALTIYENLSLMKQINSSDLDVETLLHEFGLERLKDKLPNTLSGGQRRRAMILMAIIKSPEIIFLDEPTNDLDEKWSERVLNNLKELSNTGIAIVMVSHDEQCRKYADRVLHMKSGMIS
ncbi:ABC transporter ATP-binding protein [Clostridium sp. A1-XYC3]|uniref:ABC transporter ATP-binding protein n=1 Tax=Clostridium tanneri TaxID=3037988 RepID=A0ABU4JY18_9CLOT|nr:ABC transporter ATP-binding protein [Clostridium sp. A1-XYC3]MDW8803007.1 ABC transporter ATP-binding protein [Clostridium sp. A1-XYC3]